MGPGARQSGIRVRAWSASAGRLTRWSLRQSPQRGLLAEPGFGQTTNVINGFSELIVDLYGDDVGQHARTAIGVAALPLNLCVVIAAEVEVQQ